MTLRQLNSLKPHRFDAPTLAWLALLALAVCVYGFGLGGQYIPSIGDELVYTHIARLTAASNQWLPLVSELDHMRNTKPPLLFWQALVAGDCGSACGGCHAESRRCAGGGATPADAWT